MNIKSDCILYKVWAHPFSFPHYSPAAEVSDWSAFYFQHTVRHALRYLNKKYDDGYDQVDLIRISVENSQIVRLTDAFFGDSSIGGQ